MKCRHCHAELQIPLIDLGTAPPSNAYIRVDQLNAPERWYPLRVLVCTQCWLAQTEDFTQADELFDSEYAYFSSFSNSWLRHAEAYVASMTLRLGLGSASNVVEIAANDGYLLQYVQARGIPCLGIEPTASTAAVARSKGIPIIQEFFGQRLAFRLREEGKAADLTAANNVLAHVPDINDFVKGFVVLLKPDGVATFEFPHLQRLIEERLFDIIYHEHYSYLSLTVVDAIFRNNGLTVFDVEDLPTQGGSLRVYAQRSDTGRRQRQASVDSVLERERKAGLTTIGYYASLQREAERIKHDLLSFLIAERRAGRKVGAYGAAAKGNTLLNWAGVRPDLLPWVVDLNPMKQGKLMPGSRIPIVQEDRIRHERPDTILILPWNLRAEVTEQLLYVRNWGGRFATAVPNLEVI
jgi:SAM-dependent methyltransferase